MTFSLGPFLLSQVCTSSYSLCSNLSSTWSLSDNPSPLGNGVMDTLGVPAITFPGDLTHHSMVRARGLSPKPCSPSAEWVHISMTLFHKAQRGAGLPEVTQGVSIKAWSRAQELPV